MRTKQLGGLCLLAGSLSAPAWAHNSTQPFLVHGELRLGYVASKDASGTTTAAAAGGRLSLTSRQWHGLSAGARLYTTQHIGTASNNEFFASDGQGYSILGHAYLRAEYAGTSLTAGRFTLNTPYADSDDIRMVEDNYQGVLLTSRAAADLTLRAMHLGSWSGYDAPVPEHFTAIGPHGLNALGLTYDGPADTSLRAWYYRIPGQARLTYLELDYQGTGFSLGGQLASQSGGERASGGPDGQVYGLSGAVSYRDFGISVAYNRVFGSVTNGLGGGPWFTSADIHTIAAADNQAAAAVGLSYDGLADLHLGITYTYFRLGSNETDLTASWQLHPDLHLELVYADLYGEGAHGRVLLNYRF